MLIPIAYLILFIIYGIIIAYFKNYKHLLWIVPSFFLLFMATPIIILGIGLSYEDYKTEKQCEQLIQNEQFLALPFDKATELKEFSTFLEEHMDTLTSYERTPIRCINRNGRTDTIEIKSHPSRRVIDRCYLKGQIPPHLIEDFEFHLHNNKLDFIEEIVLMPPNKITMMISVRKTASKYEMYHEICVNMKKETQIEMINFGDALYKDTLLTEGLHYGIEVLPDIGW